MNEKHLIVAIDDSKITLTQLEMLISNQRKVRFKGFIDGQQALLSQELKNAAIILLDINMPNIDGVEMLRKFAELKVQAPIALLSGESNLLVRNTATLAQLHGLSIISCLDKPLSASKLNELLRMLDSGLKPEEKPMLCKRYGSDEIHDALIRQEFSAFFQPKVACASGKVIGAEVLARWNHGDDGLVLPSQFINIMEDNGIIHLLSTSLLKQTLSLYASNRAILSGLKFSINLSVIELSDIKLPEKLSAICEDFCTPTSNIIIEITESLLLKNIKQALDILLRLKLKGFNLSIDDFGTGYSSIKQLNDLPFDELKIDRCFVNGCAQWENKRIIINNTCEMAHQLGLEVVAEGVETIEDLLVVQSYGVECVQGYYFYPPCSPFDFLQIIKTSNTQVLSSSGS